MKKFIAVILLVALCITISSCGKADSEKDLELREYIFQESEDVIPASIMLMEDNKFQFIFSGISSYIGIGSYIIDGDRLILTTDDGDYHYTFNITDDGLVFDAEASSENIWSGDFTDGSVFR